MESRGYESYPEMPSFRIVGIQLFTRVNYLASGRQSASCL